jgi:hypothetical protein
MSKLTQNFNQFNMKTFIMFILITIGGVFAIPLQGDSGATEKASLQKVRTQSSFEMAFSYNILTS